MALRKKKKRKSSGNEQEVQNAAKTLFANIRFQSVDNPIKSILITSTVPNEGKTATLSLLAQAIGSSGMRVLIVECDMRRRSMAAELNAHATYGLYSVLSGAVPINQAIVNTNYPLVQFLDSEPGIPNPADLLASKRMADLAQRLEAMFDYVLFDTPPVGTFVDAAVLSTLVDGVVIAVRPNTAKRDDLVGAVEQLQTANANILGLCGTFAEGTGSEYYYAYYTKDGKRVRRRNKGSDSSGMVTPQQAQMFAPAQAGAAAAMGASAQRGGQKTTYGQVSLSQSGTASSAKGGQQRHAKSAAAGAGAGAGA